ncbi:hypothetical protein Lrub_1493 [Legionella rubrilucens]|uniref:Uncharacterized protein n=1 Tax=Legionella rubrilucens TaxID=458 RepID=A0A0W0XT69_9GAMM|nr:hypothetical protein [Legionella rubrilucens]KTD48045.1 hypothetical protein Lrub_1493 [Legionella rubrilucens]
MRYIIITALVFVMSLAKANAGLPQVGAAPEGDATEVATRIIQDNFPECKQVTTAIRAPDGSIHATCDNIDYLVFTLFDAKKGKTIEVAMNCTAAKQLLNVSC